MLASLIMTKLPKDVITHLTDHKEDGQDWTVQLLRDKLHRFITNRENAERQCGIKDDSKHTARSMWLTSKYKEGKTTTETLFSVTKPPKDQKVKKKSTGKEELKAEEIEEAKLMWERHVQNSRFSSEINAVKKNTKNNLKDQLGLQLDQNRILRCHGRMIRENLPESSIFPKLLPKNHAFTSLLINSFHENSCMLEYPIHCQLSDENSGCRKEEQR